MTLWDVKSGRLDPTPLDSANQGVEVASSGRRLITYQASGSHYRVRVGPRHPATDPASRRPREKAAARRPMVYTSTYALLRENSTWRVEGEMRAPDATISDDDTTMALCVPGAPVQLWALATGRRIATPWAPTLTAQQCVEERLHLTPDGRRLLMTTDTKIRVWDVSSGKESSAIREPGVSEIGFSADGSFLATANAEELLIWRISQTVRPVFRHSLTDEHAFNVRIDPHTDQVRYLAGPPNASTWPTTVRTLQLNTIMNAGWRDESAQSATFSPGGTTLAITYLDRVELRDGRTGQPPRDLHASPVPQSSRSSRAAG
ncbi:WD40 repeat domain-containing protein [Nonomuraea sp. NPDC050556]|uniref:WD40 repeat domain-containing protein n=1 Tax=Nonomuraea sp. NPDC050556 TaxID=3364369 RepID=UPI0037B3F77B